jgi:peroxiredoxin
VCVAQLGRLEARRAELERSGAALVAVSVDPVERSRALVERARLGFPILSDPGAGAAKAWGVWHASKGIALPALFVVDREGRVAWRHVSEVVTDRPAEDEVLRVVRGLAPAAR